MRRGCATGHTFNRVRWALGEPAELVERTLNKLAWRRERRRPDVPYVSSANWRPELHSILAEPWPCPAVSALEPLTADIHRVLAERQIQSGRGAYASWDDADPAFIEAAWCLTRHLRPNSVVETGVARGWASRVVLEALTLNRAGHLFSIDLPPLDRQVEPEFAAAVPSARRDRWTLIQGSSRRRLPSLVRQLGRIDLFIHDSMHTRRNMEFEVRSAWDALTPAGMILVDDIHLNAAFVTLTRLLAPQAVLICESLDGHGLFGVLQKPRADRWPAAKSSPIEGRDPGGRDL